MPSPNITSAEGPRRLRLAPAAKDGYNPAVRVPHLLPQICLLAVLAAARPFPAGAQVTYLPDDAEVIELRALYLAAGWAFPVAGFPVSRRTLAGFGERLLARVADPLLAEAIGGYLEGLDGRSERVEIALVNRFALEGYLRVGDRQESSFEREYLERARLWQLDMAWSVPDKAGVLIEAFLHREYLDDLPATNLPGHRPANPVALENDQLAKGLLWYSFGPLEVEFGRDRVHFGPLRSSLLPSERLPFMDMLRVTLPLGSLTMDLMISSLQNRQAVEDLDLTGSTDFAFHDNIIFANLHRFEYDFGRIRAAVSGLGIFVRQDNAFALADFFPVSSWHATQYRPFNLSLVFDLEAALFPGFRAMTQFGFDDISTLGIGVSDSAVPTIPAVIAGVEYLHSGRAATVRVYAEGGYTHYLWGNFDDESDAILARAIYRLFLDQGTRTLPLTSPYGPGAIWTLAEVSLEFRRGFSVLLRGELVFTNPAVDLIHTAYVRDPDAGALANKTGTLTLCSELAYSPWEWLSVYGRPRLRLAESFCGFELTLGAALTFDWRRPIGKNTASVAPAGAEHR
jgi:hypothetical protein